MICDLGTGVRYFGASVEAADRTEPFQATALVTHLHWDHIQGLPFFSPILRPGASLDIIGPVQEGPSLEAAVTAAVAPPMFPVPLPELPGRITFQEVAKGCFSVGSAIVTVFPVPHVGPTNGYRIEAGGASMAYISDFQQPLDGSLGLSDVVIDACRGVDVLIHDAQYDPEEFKMKASWGHCTVEYAVEVARAAGVKRLALYHHDPGHNDEWVDRAREMADDLAGDDFSVIAAAEGLTLHSGADAG